MDHSRDAILHYPHRIVCLTEETTETLYLLGEQDRIVGVSGYTARPPEARSKPKVSAFISAKYEKIEALQPDLVLAFSDLQADIARDLAKRGLNVIVFNQRSVAEVLQMILTLARIVGVEAKGIALVEKFQSDLTAIAASAQRLPRRPRVLFEEWDDPLISGIRWVEELIEIAGGEPIFPELRDKAVAPDRVIRPDEVLPATRKLSSAPGAERKYVRTLFGPAPAGPRCPQCETTIFTRSSRPISFSPDLPQSPKGFVSCMQLLRRP